MLRGLRILEILAGELKAVVTGPRRPEELLNWGRNTPKSGSAFVKIVWLQMKMPEHDNKEQENGPGWS